MFFFFFHEKKICITKNILYEFDKWYSNYVAVLCDICCTKTGYITLFSAFKQRNTAVEQEKDERIFSNPKSEELFIAKKMNQESSFAFLLLGSFKCSF